MGLPKCEKVGGKNSYLWVSSCPQKCLRKESRISWKLLKFEVSHSGRASEDQIRCDGELRQVGLPVWVQMQHRAADQRLLSGE